MLIKSDWTRRRLLKAGVVLGTAGVLQPVIELLESGKTIEDAYPEEMLSIESFTKGKVKPGMVISKDNAELVKDICPPGLYVELTRGREIKIKETTTDITKWVDEYWIEATLRNKGLAVLDGTGQLWTKDHRPWIGGSPFPEPRNALEMAWSHYFNYWRVDDTSQTGIGIDLSGDHVLRKETEYFWQIQTVGRVLVDPKPYIPRYTADQYRQTLQFYSPFDIFGLSLLTVSPYSGKILPEEIVYVPALRRLRRVASEARFEPAWPQGTPWPSEFSVHNDPLLTSSWTFAGKRPLLYPSPTNTGAWTPATKDDFVLPLVEDQHYVRSTWELRPEIWMVDGVSHVPGAPISKKRLYIDSGILRAAGGDEWDKTGKLWRTMAFFISQVHAPGVNGVAPKKDVTAFNTGIWWADLQANTISYVFIPPKLEGVGLPSRHNVGISIEDYCTPDALMRMAKR